MLGNVDAVMGRIDTEAFSIADSGGVAIRRRKLLVCLFRRRIARCRLVVSSSVHGWAPGDPAVRFFKLAGVGCRTHIDIHKPVCADVERVHRMVASKRQPGNHRLRRALRNNRVRQEAHSGRCGRCSLRRSIRCRDRCLYRRVLRSAPSRRSARSRRPLPAPVLSCKRNQKAAFRRLLVWWIVGTGPGVHIHHAVLATTS